MEDENLSRFWKIMYIKEKIIRNSRQYYIPDNNLSIDEAMIAFNGRHYDIVYMPLKPIKYGFKIFIASESSTGYVFSYEPCSSNNHGK